MRIPKPEFRHAQEIYYTIILEHEDIPLRMAARLQEFGWDAADAAWVTLHWNKIWLAAAIANEREKRGVSPMKHAVLELLRARGHAIKRNLPAPENPPQSRKVPKPSRTRLSPARIPTRPKDKL